MRRAMSLWLPMWPIDVIRRAMRRTAAGDGGPAASFSGSLSARPVLLWSAHAGAQRVEACCDRCGRRGIVPGMGVAHARALLTRAEVDAIVFEPHDPARDAAALHRLAVWAMRFSPLVAIDTSHRSHGLWLDVSGCARLFGGEERLLRRLVRHLARFGVEGRAAMAPTFAAAAALARFGTIAVCDEASLRSALAPLPIEALRIDASIVEALHEVNVRRIDELIDLPRRQLAERFGLMLLRRIDETLGRVPELLEPIAVPPALRVERVFEGSATRREAIELAVRELLDDLCTELRRAGRGARRLELSIERPRGACDALRWRRGRSGIGEDGGVNGGAGRDARGGAGERERFVVDLARPSRRAAHLWSLLRTRVESLHLDDELGGGVDSVAVTAVRSAIMPTTQVGPLGEGRGAAADPGSAFAHRDRPGDRAAAEAAGEFVDVLLARLGPDAIVRAMPMERHLPEQSVVLRSALEISRPRDFAAAIVDADRPTILLRTPERAEVGPLAPARRRDDEAPAILRWRGGIHRIVAAIGPERIAPPWWPGGVDDASARKAVFALGPSSTCGAGTFRDYWRLRDDAGRSLWVFHDVERNAWLVHGVWA